MRTLVIEKALVKQNIDVIKDKAHGAVIYGMLSGDGGGAGTVPLAQLLRDEGITHFAVHEVEEAQALREAGFVEEEILMLRSTTDRELLEKLVDLNVVCTVSSVDTGMALNALAENRSTVVEAHIQVDTGMGFGGFLVSEPEKILLAYRSLPNVALTGIYTQLHGTAPTAGFETGIVHAAGSYALLHYDFARMDGVRAGSALLGRCRRSEDDGLVKVGYGLAPLTEVRWLPKGHTVGSGRSVTLKRATRVAVLPVGYLNGFGVAERPWDNDTLWGVLRRWRRDRKHTVRIGGQKVKIIGSIGAVETVLNVTNLKCSVGDLVSFDIDPLYAQGFRREYR